MGLPNVMVGVVAAILYKNLGVDNETIALYTSQLYLPWVLKPLWAPLLEAHRSKRWWVITMQFVMAATLGAVAFCLPLEGFFRLSLAFFWITGFASATQDTVRRRRLHDHRLGARAGALFGPAGHVLEPRRGDRLGPAGRADRLAARPPRPAVGAVLDDRDGLAAALMVGFGLWHLRVLPPGSPPPPRTPGRSAVPMREVWASFFTKPQMAMMLAVIFFYRFGEGFIEKFGPLFLLDARAAGGLGLDNAALGHINGTVGTIAFIVGAFAGGFLAARWTLARSFVVLALALNVPHLTYFYLSQAQPTDAVWIGAIVAIEKFGFGMGSVGHMLYMMQQVAPGPFRMAHYAIATGVMALTKWSTGTVSAWVWAAVGHHYVSFFGLVLLFSVPPVVLAWRAPFLHAEQR